MFKARSPEGKKGKKKGGGGGAAGGRGGGGGEKKYCVLKNKQTNKQTNNKNQITPLRTPHKTEIALHFFGTDYI